jgi:hypothetical protein
MRKVEVEAGRSVLASLRKKNGVPVDNALIELAESQLKALWFVEDFVTIEPQTAAILCRQFDAWSLASLIAKSAEREDLGGLPTGQ